MEGLQAGKELAILDMTDPSQLCPLEGLKFSEPWQERELEAQAAPLMRNMQQKHDCKSTDPHLVHCLLVTVSVTEC